MKRLAIGGALGIVIASGLALLAVFLASAWGGAARANPGTTVGIDLNPYASPANTATSLGSRQACLSVGNGQTFDVDVYVKDTPAARGWEFYLQYENALLSVTGKNELLFLAANPSSDVVPYSEAVPDTDSYYYGGAFDWSDLPQSHESGSGVLDRLTLQASASQDGVSNLQLSLVDVKDTAGGSIPLEGILNATVGVDTPLPDSDGDGLCDLGDNCPNVGNPGQEDGDGDGAGDVCDVCPSISNPGQEDADSDGKGDVCDNCPTTSNPDQANHDADPSGDACDVDDDGDGFPDVKETYHGSDPLDPQCTNASNDDAGDDSKVNDGCAKKAGTSETGAECDDSADNDSDGWVNDGCPQVGTRGESSLIEVCDGLDNDADTAVDEGYPDTNPGGPKDCLDPLVDTDGDGLMNTSDTDDDTDGDPDEGFNDAFSDAVEVWGGTDTLDACRDDTNDDAWPPDFENNGWVNISDVLKYKYNLGARYGGSGYKDHLYERRADLDKNQWLNISDVLFLKPHLGKHCA